MTKTTEALLAEALRLGPESRAELVAELLASLDGPTDPDAETAWAVEIERRVAAIEAGAVKLEPWDDVKRRIERGSLGGEKDSPDQRVGVRQIRTGRALV
jgi:putative addiction module component (TIGR02574 family)